MIYCRAAGKENHYAATGARKVYIIAPQAQKMVSHGATGGATLQYIEAHPVRKYRVLQRRRRKKNNMDAIKKKALAMFFALK